MLTSFPQLGRSDPKADLPRPSISVFLTMVTQSLLLPRGLTGEEMCATTTCKHKTGQNTAATLWDRENRQRGLDPDAREHWRRCPYTPPGQQLP